MSIFSRRLARTGLLASASIAGLLIGQASAVVIDYPNGSNSGVPIVLTDNSTQLQVIIGSATQSGVISESGGSFGLEKIGAGTLTLTGANTYTGVTTISAGTLQIGNNGTTGSISGDVTNNGALIFHRSNAITVANVISGTGSVTFKGFGGVTITGNNTYTGGTVVSEGAIILGAGGPGGVSGSSGWIVGDVALVAGTGINFNRAQNLSFDGNISGDGYVAQRGTGTLTLTGVNTYSGNTDISSRLAIARADSIGSGVVQIYVGTLQLNSSFSLAQNFEMGRGSIDTNGNNVTLSGVISSMTGSTAPDFGGLTKVGSGTLTLAGANTYTGITTINGGTLQIGGGGTSGSITGNTINNGTLAFNRSDAVTYAGTISGAGAVIKAGSGVLTLTGNNSYTGVTTVTGGTLSISSAAALGSSGSIVLNGGALEYSGATITIAQPVSLGSLGGTINAATNGTFTGVISGTGVLTVGKSGSISSTILSGANSYSGGTVIGPGANLTLSGTSASLGAGPVQNSGTLGLARIHTYTLPNSISGTGSVGQGAGLVTLTGTNTYSGDTSVNGNGIIAGALGAFSPNSVFNVSGTLRLDGFDQTVKGLVGSNPFILENGSANAATLTVNTPAGATTSFLGVFRDGGAGKLSLTKTGMGTQVISGAGQAGFTGTVTLQEGTLRFGGNSNVRVPASFVINGGILDIGQFSVQIGNLSGTGGAIMMSSALGSSLNVNNSVDSVLSSVISGTGSTTGLGAFIKLGPGKLTLRGVNTYTGNTSILEGGVAISADTALGNGLVFMRGGALIFETSFTSNRNFSIQEGGTFNTDSQVILAGNIADIGPAAFSGTGTFILTGNATHAGGTEIRSGAILQVGNGGAAGSISGNVANAGVLAFSRSDSIAFAGVISGRGTTTKAGVGTLTLLGDNTYTGNTAITAGTLQIGNGGTTGAIAGNIANSGTLAFNRSDSIAFAGVISGNGNVTKAGTGTLILSGNNTYNGGTTVAAGTLSLAHNNAAGTGAITTTGSVIDYANGLTIANGIVLASNTTQLQVLNGAVATQSGVISESGGSRPLEKIGGGTLILTGANTYTGGTTVSGGTLVIGNGGTSGAITGNVVNNATLAFNRADSITFAGIISGAGTVNQSGSGTTILTGANTYSGGTIVTGGILRLGEGGSVGTGPVTVTGGIFDAGSQALNAGNITGTGGTINLGSGGLLFNMTGNQTISSVLSGGGGVVKSGTGTLVLTGNNSFTGGITVAGGTLSLGGSNAAGTGTITTTGSVIDYASSISIANPIIINSNTTQLQVTTGSATQTGVISEAGGARPLEKIGSGTLILTGANTYTGGTTISGGTLVIGNGGISGAITGNVVNNATLAFNRSDTVAYAGVISGSGGVTKLGANLLTLSGINTYTGATTVSGGTLAVNGSVGSSAVTVASGAILSGAGTVGSTTVQSGGALAPGNSIGTLTVNGSLIFAANSTYTAEISPSAADQVVVSGTAALNGTLALVQGAGTYTAGTSLTLLTAGNVSGTFANVTGLSFANLRSEIIYGPTTVRLLLSPLAVNFVGVSANQSAVAAAINAGPLSNALQMALSDYVRANPAQMGAVLDSVSGEIHATLRSAALEGSRLIRNTVQDYLTADPQGSHVWGRVFADYGWLDSDGNAAESRRNHAGFIAGMDTHVAEGLRIGLGGAYMEHKVGAAARGSNATGTRGALLAYASYDSGAFGVQLGGDYGWGSDDIVRSVAALGETETSRRDNNGGGFFARVTYNFGLPVNPYAGFAHASAQNGVFAETGGLAALRGSAVSDSQTHGLLGFNLSLEALDLGGMALTPRADIAWSHGFDVTAPGQAVTLATGQAFQVLGTRVGADAAALQLGFDLQLAPTALLSVGYDGLLSSQGQSHAIRGGLNWRF